MLAPYDYANASKLLGNEIHLAISSCAEARLALRALLSTLPISYSIRCGLMARTPVSSSFHRSWQGETENLHCNVTLQSFCRMELQSRNLTAVHVSNDLSSLWAFHVIFVCCTTHVLLSISWLVAQNLNRALYTIIVKLCRLDICRQWYSESRSRSWSWPKNPCLSPQRNFWSIIYEKNPRFDAKKISTVGLVCVRLDKYQQILI